MFEVPDQLAEDPRLVGIRDSPELLLHHGLREDLRPSEVMERDLADLAPVDLRGMLARRGRDLVRDGDDRVEALLTSDVEVVLELLGDEWVAAGLHLHQGGPRATSSAHANEAIGVQPLLAELEWHFDEGGDRARRSAEGLQDAATELADG